MTKSNRIQYLKDCLVSLIRQNVQIPIYLSISFENLEIHTECMQILYATPDVSDCNFLNIQIRPQKTPQMQHFYLLQTEFGANHSWIMFCDDDDAYTPDRTEHFMNAIIHGSNTAATAGKQFAGAYENAECKHHAEQRQEYWSYCVNTHILKRFFDVVAPHVRVLQDKCCDVLFGEYLRRLSQDWIYAIITKSCYLYRIESNAESITGFIRSKQGYYHPQRSSPPTFGSPDWTAYVSEWNEFLHNNLNAYLHDTYLRTLIGSSFDHILKSEFLSNYPLLEYVDQIHVQKLEEWHKHVRLVCDILYDVPLV